MFFEQSFKPHWAAAWARPLAKRLCNGPIISQQMLPAGDGDNINGPSLVETPKWLPQRLGRYYLYFAHHKGAYIRLAFADRLTGPWKIYEPGTLRLDQTPDCRGHIASPDVHVDHERQEMRMYFHGPLRSRKGQHTCIARSRDGLDFDASAGVIADSYLRMVPWWDEWIGMTMEGRFYHSPDGLTNFTRTSRDVLDVTAVEGLSLRHVALHLSASKKMHVYYTLRGAAPESVWRCTVDLKPDWGEWRARNHELVLKPEMPWEGADQPVARSRPGAAQGTENALRDPAIFVGGRSTYLLYSVAGESGIAIAKLTKQGGVFGLRAAGRLS